MSAGTETPRGAPLPTRLRRDVPGRGLEPAARMRETAASAVLDMRHDEVAALRRELARERRRFALLERQGGFWRPCVYCDAPPGLHPRAACPLTREAAIDDAYGWHEADLRDD